MALSNLKVFNDYAYGVFREKLAENVQLFNAATDGGIVLTTSSKAGDYWDTTFWAAGSVVERRNANAETAISSYTPSMGQETRVRVDARTKQLILQKAHLARIGQSPDVQGAIFGQMVAEQAFSDMLTVGLGAWCSAMAAVGATVSTDFSGTAGISWVNLMNLKQLRGDAASDIRCWVMHSILATGLLVGNLNNDDQLFSYGGVNVMSDPQGRRIVVTDLSSLVIAGTPTDYYVPGLAPGAIVIEEQGDWRSNEENRNGKEQIETSYQAEWSYFVGLRGFAWDKTNGGTSPSTAALLTATNWDRVYNNSVKDLGGVLGRFTP